MRCPIREWESRNIRTKAEGKYAGITANRKFRAQSIVETDNRNLFYRTDSIRIFLLIKYERIIHVEERHRKLRRLSPSIKRILSVSVHQRTGNCRRHFAGADLPGRCSGTPGGSVTALGVSCQYGIADHRQRHAAPSAVSRPPGKAATVPAVPGGVIGGRHAVCRHPELRDLVVAASVVVPVRNADGCRRVCFCVRRAACIALHGRDAVSVVRHAACPSRSL